MTTMVCFDSAGASYCLPVHSTRAVRQLTGMISLPAPGVDIAGIIPGDPPLTVISPLGAGGKQVLVVEAGEKVFGLLVEAVTGLRRIADADIDSRPEGQERALVCGTIDTDGELVLVADATALAGRL